MGTPGMQISVKTFSVLQLNESDAMEHEHEHELWVSHSCYAMLEERTLSEYDQDEQHVQHHLQFDCPKVTCIQPFRSAFSSHIL